MGALEHLVGVLGDDAGLMRELESVVETLVTATQGGGHVYTTGVGKSAIVARRMAASLTSIGMPTSFYHGVEWVHGDLGALREGDAVVAISHSVRAQVSARWKGEGGASHRATAF